MLIVYSVPMFTVLRGFIMSEYLVVEFGSGLYNVLNIKAKKYCFMYGVSKESAESFIANWSFRG